MEGELIAVSLDLKCGCFLAAQCHLGSDLQAAVPEGFAVAARKMFRVAVACLL